MTKYIKKDDGFPAKNTGQNTPKPSHCPVGLRPELQQCGPHIFNFLRKIENDAKS
jgi:hypothetical protein